MAKLTEANSLRMSRIQSNDYTFGIDEISGTITLEKALRSDVHYYELVVTSKNRADGPTSKIDVRFYPITEENTVRVQTKNYLEFNEEEFAEELAELYGQDASVVINDVLPLVRDESSQGNQVQIKISMI